MIYADPLANDASYIQDIIKISQTVGPDASQLIHERFGDGDRACEALEDVIILTAVSLMMDDKPTRPEVQARFMAAWDLCQELSD